MAADSLRRLASLLFGAVCAIMFGFAAGALWMVPAMMFGRALPALALPAGWLLGLVVRRWLSMEGAVGASLAALATLVAATYTSCLVAAATISGMMNVSFAQAISDAGPGMLLALARLALDPSDLGLFIAGALLAAITALPIKRPRS
ncbi:hypothetical protein KR767_01790 [Luteibacter anthropi]|uniref:Uncharacterized protein n=1 Tax=Luteibacter anthropi TaxID=564369 RepID=A0A7X5ZJZ5_9GAMM|nr:hypothetical protein [Luteibacter anthropi]NII08482.1 hypothetical protein [Luteibacter anthropi]URX62827.1 hypothetical protein KR767_01790 [Luteibacter anthropi]